MAELPPQELAYQKEHLHDDRRIVILVVALVMAVVATVAVTLRFACRRHMKVGTSCDDYLILAALVRLTCVVCSAKKLTIIQIFALGQCFLEGYSKQLPYAPRRRGLAWRSLF